MSKSKKQAVAAALNTAKGPKPNKHQRKGGKKK